LRRILIILLAVLAFCAGSVSADEKKKKNDNPAEIGSRDLNKHSLNFYSPEREALLGAELAHEAEITSRVLVDPFVLGYVKEVADRVARNSDLQMPVRVCVVDSDLIAAFALPGGHFFVTTGLLRETRSEAELAGVVAHEIAHVAARHGTKQMSRAQLWNYLSLPLGFVSGPVAAGIKSGMMLAMPLSFLKFSRNFEREADSLGLQYDYASGYDPAAMVDFFERMKAREKEKDHGSIAKVFSSHPMTKDRIVAAEKTIDQSLPSREQYVVTTSRFEEVRRHLHDLEVDRIRAEKIYGPDPLGRKNPSEVGTLFGWPN
jgi:predicted Zn-dependent protease